MGQVGKLLDESIVTKGYVIHSTEETSLIDLSQIDFEALKEHFSIGRKRTEAEKMKQAVGNKLQAIVVLNKTRTDFMEKFNKLIDEYNKGLDVDGFFAKLITFVKELSEEEQRGLSEQLTEEEVKKVARMLFQTLKEAKLVLDWRKKQSVAVQMFIQRSKLCWTNFHGPTRRNFIIRSATRFISASTTVIRVKDEVFTR